MDEVQARVQKAVSSMVNSLDKECLRKMQADMYRCSTKCCENQSSSLEEVQNCIDRCSTNVNKAQTYIQNELQNYQSRLQRCAMDCQDKVRDKVSPSATEEELSKHKGELEKCVVKCADTHIDLIQPLLKKMKEVISKNQM
ncbi:protein FAM136A-like isoform X1 [Gigantopelta aegis]|uniref:protein FAM136A-like isoform X1 n=1 Tax=Gigantopelta aegis TaxID=1735272 RepID=UPI001B8894E9|nr:protein FAM136A-like isoform X1 [Gigantopelta aegis]